MKKNLFEVSETEKKLIIKKHLEATKNNYLIESEKLQANSLVELVIMASQRENSPEYEMYPASTLGCYSTKILDGARGTVDQDIIITACNGGYFEIAETVCWGKITGIWEVDDENYEKTHCNENDCPIRIKLRGKTIEGVYEAAYSGNPGSLFPDLICYIMNNTCEGWKYFWERWSWNVDDLMQVANEGTACNIPQCFTKFTDQGFLESSFEIFKNYATNPGLIKCPEDGSNKINL